MAEIEEKFPRSKFRGMQRDFKLFCDVMLDSLRKSGSNICESAPFHLKWIEELPKHDYMLIIAYRGSAKTQYCSNLYPLWRAIQKPRCIVLMASSEIQSKLNTQFIQFLVESTPVLSHLKGDTWSKETCRLSNGSLIVAKGFGSSIRGIKTAWERPSLVVFDDIIPDVPTKSLEEYKRIYYEAVLPTIEPGAQVIVVGTPFTPDDLLASLKKSGECYVMTVPVWDENKNPSWPARHPREWIEMMKRRSNPIAWARNFKCIAMVPGGNMLKTHWLKRCDVNWIPGRDKIRIMAVDPAITSSKIGNYGTDYFAIVIVDYYYRKGIFKVISMRNEYLDFPSQVELVKRTCMSYKPRYVAIESNFYQSALAQFLKASTEIPIIEVKQSRDKVERILELTPYLQAGKIYIACVNEEFEIEYANFPSPKSHDDLLDALHMAIMESMKFAPGRSWGFI